MTIQIKLLCLLFLASYSINALADERNIYLVRHAEKQQDGTRDPSLTVEGKLRAQNLSVFLSDKKISKVFSTNYKRTLETASVLARLNNLEVQLYDPRQLKDFAKKIITIKGNIFIVGHSNTTPELAFYLDGSRDQKLKAKLDETDYEKLYHVQIRDAKITTKLLLQKIISDSITQ